MNLAGKIFVVLNLVLSVAFAAASLSLYAKKINYREEAAHYLALYNQEQETADERLEAIEDLEDRFSAYRSDKTLQIENLENARDRFQEQVVALQQDKDRLSATTSDLTQEVGELRALLQSTQDERKQIQQALAEANRAKEQAQDDLDYARRAALEATSDLNELQAQYENSKARMASLMEQNLEMRVQLRTYRQKAGPLVQVTEGPSVQVSGKVLRVDETVDLVIINLGEKDKLEPGMELTISRGSEYIGKVKIRNLYENMASAIIQKDMTPKPIQEGDTAQTL